MATQCHVGARRLVLSGSGDGAAGDPRRHFHATYLRTTVAVAEELRRGGFGVRLPSRA
jgi:hypothetical protein